MSLLQATGITEEVYKSTEAQEIKTGGVMDSGIYLFKVNEVGVFKTDKGATMVKVEVETQEEQKLTQYICTAKRDGTSNKFGAKEFKALIQATNTDEASVATKDGSFKAYGKDVNGMLVIGMIGSKFKGCVRKVYDASNESYPESNNIEAYLTIDGLNGNGDDITEEFLNKIEKSPVLIKKPKNGEVAKQEPKADGTAAVANW